MTLEEISNYMSLPDGIGTAGQPTEEQIAVIRSAGYELVVNLLPETPEALPNERELVIAQGMEFERIPVLWNEPLLDDLQRFFETMEASRGRRVFVHCAANKRASTFVFLYRVLRGNVDQMEALQNLHHVWTPNPIWQRLIDRAMTRLALPAPGRD